MGREGIKNVFLGGAMVAHTLDPRSLHQEAVVGPPGTHRETLAQQELINE